MIRTFWKRGKDFGLVKYDPLNSFDILDRGERHTANLSLSARATCQWSTSCWHTKQFLGCLASCWDDELLETTFSGGLETESTNKQNLFYLLIGSCRFLKALFLFANLECFRARKSPGWFQIHHIFKHVPSNTWYRLEDFHVWDLYGGYIYIYPCEGIGYSINGMIPGFFP